MSPNRLISVLALRSIPALAGLESTRYVICNKMGIGHFHTLVFFLFFFLPFTHPAVAATFLEKGAESFAAGDYKQAVTAFTEAEKESPNDLRIIYNLGAAQAASGNFADAVATLRKSALSKDAELAAKSLTLLGDIAVAQARLLLVPPPGETPLQDRPAIHEHLAAAERVYAEAMELKPSETESLRRNIEQIRAWKNRTESYWNLADREKKRQELELPQRFDWLEQWERKIRTDLKRTVSESDSPKKFQAFYDTSKEQQRLLEELPPLKESLRQTLPEDSAASFVSAIGNVVGTAAATNNALREMRGQAALGTATTTVEQLDFLKNCLRPFQAIVQDATTKQESLCQANQTGDPDFDEQAWEQNFVAVRMPLMLDKAKQESPTPEDPNENLQKAKELALQYGPEIESLAAEASGLLREKNPEAALPKQERALELLREILKHLQQNQDQNQDKEQDENKDQKKEQNPNEQDSKNQQGQNDEQNQSETKEEEKKSDGKEQMPQEKKEELEKAERMLRQVKRWQQSADERREKVRSLLMQLEPVDKDW